MFLIFQWTSQIVFFFLEHFNSLLNICQHTKGNNTHEKGVPPHPARAVKILGPRSLAGFNPNPALIPKQVPMVRTINPIKNGAMLDCAPIFLLSSNAKMVPTNNAVPKACVFKGRLKASIKCLLSPLVVICSPLCVFCFFSAHNIPVTALDLHINVIATLLPF